MRFKRLLPSFLRLRCVASFCRRFQLIERLPRFLHRLCQCRVAVGELLQGRLIAQHLRVFIPRNNMDASRVAHRSPEQRRVRVARFEREFDGLPRHHAKRREVHLPLNPVCAHARLHRLRLGTLAIAHQFAHERNPREPDVVARGSLQRKLRIRRREDVTGWLDQRDLRALVGQKFLLHLQRLRLSADHVAHCERQPRRRFCSP